MTTTMTLGIDLGDKTSHWCLLDAAGVVVHRDRVRSRPVDFRALFARFAAAENKPVVVIEAGGQSRWVDELGKQAGLTMIVASPKHVRLIYGGTTKTDKFDAEALARLARVDTKLLHPVTTAASERRRTWRW